MEKVRKQMSIFKCKRCGKGINQAEFMGRGLCWGCDLDDVADQKKKCKDKSSFFYQHNWGPSH